MEHLEENESRTSYENAEAEEKSQSCLNKKNITKILLASIVIGFIVYVIIDTQGDNNIRRISQDFLQWVQDNPGLGVFAFIGVYFLATVLFIPGSLLTLGAGFVFGNRFGVGIGVLLASAAVFIGATIGAIGAFILGRYVFRESIQRLAQKYPIFQAIDYALGNNGFRIVLLLRLSPIIPFNAINYILGTTAVPLRDYSLASIGMLPGTILYVFLGSSAGSIVESSSSGGNKALTISLIVVGVVFGVGAVAIVTHYAKKELKKILDENEEDPSSNNEVEVTNV